MIAKDVVDSLRREPFDPFRIVTSSGESIDVLDPLSVAPMKSRLFVALPDDRWTFVPYLHIKAIESLQS